MQGYIDALLQNGVSRPVSKTRDIHSVNYFRKESRDILKYASQKLCKDPNSTSMQQCIHYVDDLLGDTEEGREL
ncbi:MAG: hypothetical protein LBG52_05555 [Candidatus Peribacteria bacterium]|nr:hypothetical protein [Candidatus Peribacteria bacterium]